VIFSPTAIDGAYLIDIEPHADRRGFFARCWCEREFRAHGAMDRLVQASIAFTHRQGTVRGIHYQAAPYGEAKLVRCTRGAAFVVAVDLRVDSPTYTAWFGAEVTADNRQTLYVPPGCGQGYQTLCDRTEMMYQMSQSYVPEAARGIRYDDPAFGIQWPLDVQVISEKDRTWPRYALPERAR
jgi:dTDP-4-dehydrorhamnose 3,5-epimerase